MVRIRERTTANEPVVKKEVKQQGYEDSGKRTKIWSDDERNREEQSQQQAREEQSQRQARTTTETRRSRRNTVHKKVAASDADVQQGQGEVTMTIPKIDFTEEIVECKINHRDRSETSTQKVQKTVEFIYRSVIDGKGSETECAITSDEHSLGDRGVHRNSRSGFRLHSRIAK